MYRTLVIAASFAALAVPAFAQDVTITLAGKTKAQIVAEIHKAAKSVCLNESFLDLNERSNCVADLEHDAMDQLTTVEHVSGKFS
jgi:hypothetical protein